MLSLEEYCSFARCRRKITKLSLTWCRHNSVSNKILLIGCQNNDGPLRWFVVPEIRQTRLGKRERDSIIDRINDDVSVDHVTVKLGVSNYLCKHIRGHDMLYWWLNCMYFSVNVVEELHDTSNVIIRIKLMTGSHQIACHSIPVNLRFFDRCKTSAGDNLPPHKTDSRHECNKLGLPS